MIIHYLTIQTCKRVFFDPEYGVVRSIEPLFLDRPLTLQPLCLFGVSVDGWPLKHTEYCSKDDVSFSASQFLKNFWERSYKAYLCKQEMPILKGMPDLLVIDHRSKDLLQKNFFDWLDSNNIQYEFSDSTSKKAIAKFLQHQDYPDSEFIEKRFMGSSYVAALEPNALSIETLNHHQTLRNYFHPDKKQLSSLLELQERFSQLPIVREAVSCDVDLNGINPLRGKSDRAIESAYWVFSDLEKGKFGYLRNRKEQHIADSDRLEKKAFLAAIKSLSENQLNDIFTAPQMALVALLKKQQYKDTTDIDSANYAAMCYSLGMSLEPSYSKFVFNTTKLSRGEMREIWDQYSNGGDVFYSCELLLPLDSNSPDTKDYRCFYLNADHADVFFVCESNSATAKTFDNHDCLNYMSNEQFQVSEFINSNFNIDQLLSNESKYTLFLSAKIKMRVFYGVKTAINS